MMDGIEGFIKVADSLDLLTVVPLYLQVLVLLDPLLAVPLDPWVAFPQTNCQWFPGMA